MIAKIKKIEINEISGLTTIVLAGENGIEFYVVAEKRRDLTLVVGTSVVCGYYENLYSRSIDSISPLV